MRVRQDGIAGIGALLVLTTLACRTLWAQAAAPATPAAEPLPESVPLTQIALRSQELNRILRDIARQLPSPTDLSAFSEQLAEQEAMVKANLRETTHALSAGPTILEIRELARRWRAYSSPESRQRKTLDTWGAVCERNIATLKHHESVWRATLAGSAALEGLDSLRVRVRQAVNDVLAAHNSAEERLRTVVDLQSRVSKLASEVFEMSEKLDEATRTSRRSLLVADANPIWRAWRPPEDADSMPARFKQAMGESYSGLREPDGARQGVILGFIGIVILLLGVYAYRRLILGKEPADELARQAFLILSRPISLAVLLSAPWILPSLPTAQRSIGLVILLLFLLPIARLMPLIVGCSTRVSYVVGAFYTLNALVWVLDTGSFESRLLTIVFIAATLAFLVWRGRPLGILRRRPTMPGERAPARLVMRAAFAILLLVFVANILGFLRLSNLVRSCAVVTSQLGLVIYTLARVVSILTATALRARRLQPLATIRLHQAGLLKWIRRSIDVVAVVWWTYMVLDLLAIKSDVSRAISTALNARLAIKAFSISLGDVLALFLVLTAGSLIAGAIRFILREEILSRLRLSRGVPEMISTSLYYVLLLVVFLMSLSAAGLQLDKLTVLTGAIGVGLGFGLQGLVNNFVSGLVLQFERPIRVGDVLEMGTLSGEVRHIGIRSSTVRTFQGADVIIPNSALITTQVINWTLSESRRRVDLQIPVAYGTAPEEVIQMLTAAARNHREVLRSPEPAAFFQGFGPCAMDFVLMFWAEQSTHFRLRSEIAIAVNAALQAAGIEIPLPQQEIRVRSGDLPALTETSRAGRI